MEEENSSQHDEKVLWFIYEIIKIEIRSITSLQLSIWSLFTLPIFCRCRKFQETSHAHVVRKRNTNLVVEQFLLNLLRELQCKLLWGMFFFRTINLFYLYINFTQISKDDMARFSINYAYSGKVDRQCF